MNAHLDKLWQQLRREIAGALGVLEHHAELGSQVSAHAAKDLEMARDAFRDAVDAEQRCMQEAGQ